MSLLDDFKTKTGATEADQYLISYYLQPALDLASSVTNNKKQIEVTLISGTNAYDLTSSLVSSPVVGVGVQQISVDDDYQVSYVYKDDYYFSDPTTLYFVDPTNISGTIKFNYFAYYKIPVASPYEETDLPVKLYPSVLKYASALYARDKITDLAGGEAVQQISEYNLSKSFGAQTTRLAALQTRMDEAIKDMKDIGGWASRILGYSIQIV